MNRRLKQFMPPAKAARKAAGWVVLLTAPWLVTGALAAPQEANVQAQVSAAIDHYIHDFKDNRFSRLESEVQPLDPRLQLTACDAPLDVEHRPRNRFGGRITFKVTCNGSTSWMIHIPANIKTFSPVVVAASSIPMGTQLSTDDLELTEMDVSSLHRGYFHEIAEVTGFVAKRPIPAGQVLSPIVVDPAKVVSKGETVAILAESPGITIRATGVAMADGALGELIKVRNTKSDKVVEGRISGPGQIKVSL